jgi:hypothetical protein
MRSEASDPELDSLLAKFDTAGGVVDYVFLERPDAGPPHIRHRAAALAGMAEIDRRLEQWAARNASAKYPIEMFFRVRWDESKLIGTPVSFPTFWGTDDVEPKPIGDRAWSIPNVDGYKTAFFHPPYGLYGLKDSPTDQTDLFASINTYVLGADPERAEIFSWSTDWSNYFEAGHEWWGAFYWTINPADSQRMVVVAASSTD